MAVEEEAGRFEEFAVELVEEGIGCGGGGGGGTFRGVCGGVGGGGEWWGRRKLSVERWG